MIPQVEFNFSYVGFLCTLEWDLVMRLTSGDFRIGGPKGKRALRLIVDAGSVYTWVPGEVRRSIGIIRTETIAFPTIEGRKVRRDVGRLL